MPSKKLILSMLLAAVTAISSSFAIDFTRLQDEFKKKFGQQSLPTFMAWQNFMNTSTDLQGDDKIKRSNEMINRIVTWQEDQKIWGQQDYWATPLETLSKKMGDCEDFAIIKYFSLKNLNVPISQLRLVYVKAKNGSGGEQAHMVLAYYPAPDSEPLILDNMLNDIRPASRRPDLTPVFSFNSEGIYNGAAGKDQQSGGIERLSKWQDLLQRAQAEGFN
jgi:hypothetical protein